MTLRCFVFLACSSLGLAAELHFIPGGNRPGINSSKGELVSLSDKNITWRDESNNVLVEPVDRILRIDLRESTPLPPGLKYTDVELTDGTLLHCTRFALKGREAELKLAGSDQAAKVPLDVLTYVLNDAQEAANRQEWQDKILAKKNTSDILAIKRDGVLNALEGTLGEGNDKGQILFEFGSGDTRTKRAVDPARIHGLFFVRSPNLNAPSPLCKVYDVHDNAWVASKLALDAKGFTVTAVAGPTITYPRPEVARLDYTNDKVAFLSDLRPVQMIEKSKQGRKENLRIDKNLDNTQLKVEGETYAKGLAIHSHTELVYDLNGKYAKFEAAILGMDDMVGGDGQPVVKIEADGKELLSEVITRKHSRKNLTFDIKGVKQLRIVVTSSGLFDFGDHVDLANPKLSK